MHLLLQIPKPLAESVLLCFEPVPNIIQKLAVKKCTDIPRRVAFVFTLSRQLKAVAAWREVNLSGQTQEVLIWEMLKRHLRQDNLLQHCQAVMTNMKIIWRRWQANVVQLGITVND